MIPIGESTEGLSIVQFNEDAIATLQAGQENVDRAASSYWTDAIKDFSVGAEGSLRGSTVLGLLAQPTDRLRVISHKALQAPFVALGFARYSRFRDVWQTGKLVAHRTGRMFTYDILRQVLSLALIREHVSLAGEGPAALVIGDGFGVMTSLLVLSAPQRKIIAVNLAKSLLLDMSFARRAAPDKTIALAETPMDLAEALTNPSVSIIAVRADDARILAAAPLGLVINVVSMQEMNPDVIAGYFAILRENPSPETLFYCANRLTKTLPDGTEIRFSDYPWHHDDVILRDEICTWNQWTYSRRPPFWHYRWGKHRIVWHRLAKLAKAARS